MRKGFAHEAVVSMEPDADVRAPGAAITVELCGHADHEPPCPFSAHHTRADRLDGEVHLSILFATAPELEAEVRQQIDAALSRGRLCGPDGVTTHWRLRLSRRRDPLPSETAHVERLTRG